MRSRAAARLAWSMWVLSAVLTALALSLLALSWIRPGASVFDVFDYWVHATAIALAFSTVGALIASHRAAHPVGWLFCAIGLLVAIDHFCGQYATYALLVEPHSLPAGEAAAWVHSWIWIVSGAVGVFLVLVFPDGHLASTRWRYLAWLNVAVAAVGAAAVAFSPGPIDGIEPIRNPLGISSLGPLLGQRVVDVVEGVQVGVALCALFSPFARLRRAGFEERQQIKWFAYAATVLIVGALLTSLVPAVWTLRWVWWVGFALYIGGIVGLPVAVGIAILRHHLYNIDTLINRTLVYGSLTAVLAAVYVGSVVALQEGLRALTGETSQVAVVASTLAIAALFSPLRHRIQSFIDRRFYRRKYDVAKTLEDFSAKLRDETDLDALTNDVLAVVRDTMQPAYASFWLRPDAAPKVEKSREPRA